MLAAAHLLLESVGELYGGVAAYGISTVMVSAEQYTETLP